MRKLFSVTILVAAALGVLGFSSAARPAWAKVRASVADFEYNYAGFRTDAHGVAVGPSGEIHFTIDGGKTWPLAENTGWCLFGLDFAGEEEVYACGNMGTFIRSGDKGEFWGSFDGFGYGDEEPDHARYLCFAGDGKSIVATDRLAAYTLDGGENWAELELPGELGDPSGAPIAQVAILKSGTIKVLTTDGLLFSSADRGRSWKRSDLKQGAIAPTASYQPTVAMRFTDEKTGTVAYYSAGDSAWLLLESADGGAGWKRSATIRQDPGAAYLSPDGKYLTLCANGEIALFAR